ncbi:MAG: hypothetical protein COA79_03785 [Planctomycetota bacterium]|nr:MAG: hypothetical protein COA79_03785 [Planctomycetota bacterium]
MKFSKGSFLAKNVYRPISRSNINMPFSLRSVGHCRAGIDWIDNREKKTFVQIFWCIEGRGKFHINDTYTYLNKGETFVYFPGEEHFIISASDYWEYRFFTIDGPLAKSIVESFGLTHKSKYSGPCPVKYFLRLENEVLNVSEKGQKESGQLAYELLTKVSCHNVSDHYSNIISSCLELIDQKLSHTELNINYLSNELGIHRSQLSRQFKTELGLTAIDYLIAKRVQKGLVLLEEYELSIKDISIFCGYSQPDYFSKAIVKATGKTPREIRKLNGLKPKV